MKFLHLIVLLLFLSITSCIPYHVIDIQYISKPELNTPTDFNKPAILVNYYSNISKNLKESFEYTLDSIASIEAVHSLKEKLEDTPWFQDLDIPIISYLRDDNSKYIKPLTWPIVDEICAKDTFDLVISLEYMKVQPNTDTYRTTTNGIESYYGYLQQPIYCYWRIYNVNPKQIPVGYLYKDTLLWDANDWIPVEPGKQLPGFVKTAEYIGVEAGDRFAQMISPTWVDSKRLVFNTGSTEMKKAADFAINGNWIDAAIIWQRVISSKSKKLSAKAAYNLALASEMLGKFDISIEWLNKAGNYYPLIEIDEYKSIIKNRIANK